MRLINIESIHKDDNMKEEQTNITSDYKGDFTEIEGTPTLNGKRMGIFEKKRFNYWRERNLHFIQQIEAKGLDINASYEVIKNDSSKWMRMVTSILGHRHMMTTLWREANAMVEMWVIRLLSNHMCFSVKTERNKKSASENC